MIKTEFTSPTQAFILMKAVYQQSRKFSMTNLNLQVAGYLFETFDPLNLNVSNMTIDYYQTTRGFYIVSACNAANASLTGTLSFSNITTIR